MPAPWRIRKPGGRVAAIGYQKISQDVDRNTKHIRNWMKNIIKDNGSNIPGIAYRFADAFGLQVTGMVK